MIIVAHLNNTINVKKKKKIIYFLEALRSNFLIDNVYIYCIDKKSMQDIHYLEITHDNDLFDISTYLDGIDIALSNVSGCIFVNDTFFENKLLFIYRVNCLIRKIRDDKKIVKLVGHVINKKSSKYISSYLMYMNFESIKFISKSYDLKVLKNEGIKSFNTLLKQNEILKNIYLNNSSIFSISDNYGIKWHNNLVVTENVRNIKHICSVIELYISYLFLIKSYELSNISDLRLLFTFIYKIENKITLYKSKFAYFLSKNS